MSSAMRHQDLDMLLRFVDRDLSPADALAVEEHVRICSGCGDDLQTVCDAIEDYGKFHRNVLKPALPAPPAEWKPLEFAKLRRVFPHSARWLVAAAAFAVAFVLARRFETAPSVRAAEILRKAMVAESAASRPAARLRIHARSLTLDRNSRITRSAAVESGDASALHALFDSAGYDWNEPLSASTFSRWRTGIETEQDRVDETAGIVRITTFAGDGGLAEAALSLRASDLHAVACTLRLRSSGEVIEIREIPLQAEESVPPVAGRRAPGQAAAVQSAPIAVVPPAKAATAADELHVIAALHRIGADLGEPVDVRRDGANVAVEVTILDGNRRDQIRAALAAIPVAQLRFNTFTRDDSKASLSPSRNDAPTGAENPLISELRASPGNDIGTSQLADELIDATDRASQRAFALRALSRRFPPATASGLDGPELEIIRGIVRDHARGLATAIQEIRRMLAPVLQGFVPETPPSDATVWQSRAENLPIIVEQLDRTLNGATDASSARKAHLAGLIADLELQASALEGPAQR